LRQIDAGRAQYLSRLMRLAPKKNGQDGILATARRVQAFLHHPSRRHADGLAVERFE